MTTYHQKGRLSDFCLFPATVALTVSLPGPDSERIETAPTPAEEGLFGRGLEKGVRGNGRGGIKRRVWWR